MSKAEKNRAIFWDYDLAKMDFNEPAVKLWYFNRKLNFGDLSGIKKSELKKYLPELSINPSLRELLKNFLAQYARD